MRASVACEDRTTTNPANLRLTRYHSAAYKSAPPPEFRPSKREAAMTSRHLSFANRRKFLAQAGGLAAIAAGAPFGIGDVNVSAEELGPREPNQRVGDACQIRHEAALL